MADRNQIIFYIVVIAASYLVGSISPSTIIAKMRGIDIKKEGSGNAGTTNALRVLGGKAAVITLCIDILKGTAAVFLSATLTGDPLFGYFACAAAFIGHIFPVYYSFKGGKGVAVAFGGLLGVNWKLALILLLIVAVLTVLSKRMSVGSIAGAISAVPTAWLLEPEFLPFAAVLATVILVKHKGNIARLIKGEEPPMSIFVKKKGGDG